MRALLISLTVLIFCASCTFKKKEADPVAESTATTPVPRLKQAADPAPVKMADREAQKILHWFEQMDAIYRESLWVIRKERAPQGKSIFGKMQRALLVDMKQKLSNKSLFRCDVYSMSRSISGLGGVPQTAEVMHQCNTKESFIKIGDWSHPKAEELTMNFRGGNLSEVLGFTTGILSPKISCKIKSTENGIIVNFSCDGLMIDYNPAKNQVLRFNQYEYQKNSKNMLYIKAEVLENLDPVRKIEVNIPLEGKITVTETVLQQPEYLAKQVPATPPPAPAPTKPSPVNPEAISAEDMYHDRNGKEIDRQENPQSRGIRQAPSPAPQNPNEGVIESNDQARPQDQEQIQQQQIIQQPPQRQQGYEEGQQPQAPANGQDNEAHDQNRDQNTR